MSNIRNVRASALALAVIGTLFVGHAAASGFQLREQSVKNLGDKELSSAAGGGQTDYHISVCVTNCRASACVCPLSMYC